MHLNRRTLPLGVFILLIMAFSVKIAEAFSFPDMNMPTISMPSPSFPQAPTNQTQIQVTSSTSPNNISYPTPTPTRANNTPTPTPKIISQQTLINSVPTWLQSFSTIFNWITPTPKPTQESTVTPTIISTIIISPTPTQSSPTPTSAISHLSLIDDKQQYMLDAINIYRSKNNLYAVKPSKETCDYAKVRAKEIITDFSHSGWEARVNNNTIPFDYSMITENIAMTSDYTNVVRLWISSPGHAANMRSDTPYVCVAYSGNYYAYEGMRP